MTEDEIDPTIYWAFPASFFKKLHEKDIEMEEVKPKETESEICGKIEVHSKKH